MEHSRSPGPSRELVQAAQLARRDEAAWREVLAKASGPKVLFATSIGSYQHGAVIESMLAAALALRGARVEALLCDDALRLCMCVKHGPTSPAALATTGTSPRCRACFNKGTPYYADLGIPIHRYGALLTDAERAKAQILSQETPADAVAAFRLDGLAVGQHAMAGALRYFARGDLRGEPFGPRVLALYLESALLTVFALRRLLTEGGFDVVCGHHGIYVPQGVVGEVCRSLSVRVAHWNPAYRRHCFIFSHEDTYHHTMLSEPATAWEGLELTSARRARLEAYLASRRQAASDWIWFHDKEADQGRSALTSLPLDPDKPVVAALTSVVWDACLHYPSNAFPDMATWLRETIDAFSRRPDLQLVIRVHPAEVTGFVPSRQPMAEEVARLFPKLPDNVFLVPPESPLSTYALIERSNAVIVYSTKTGVEAACAGIPVIVAGEAWVRGKGFTLDADSPARYREILDSLPLAGRLDEEARARALRYGYHFFFRRMIALPFVHQGQGSDFGLDLGGLEELASGRHEGLDLICRGILEGTPFALDGESGPLPDTDAGQDGEHAARERS